MQALITDPADNIAVVSRQTNKGETVVLTNGQSLKSRDAIPTGHKIAMQDIPEGQMIVKYGVPIGMASADIAAGDHVHIHNVKDITEQLCIRYAEEYRREGGDVID